MFPSFSLGLIFSLLPTISFLFILLVYGSIVINRKKNKYPSVILTAFADLRRDSNEHWIQSQLRYWSAPEKTFSRNRICHSRRWVIGSPIEFGSCHYFSVLSFSYLVEEDRRLRLADGKNAMTEDCVKPNEGKDSVTQENMSLLVDQSGQIIITIMYFFTSIYSRLSRRCRLSQISRANIVQMRCR